MLSDSLGTMAMVNYPYSTNFVNPLPAWPLKEACNAALIPDLSLSMEKDSNDDTSTFNFTHIG
jgi:hypothetical protein